MSRSCGNGDHMQDVTTILANFFGRWLERGESMRGAQLPCNIEACILTLERMEMDKEREQCNPLSMSAIAF